MKRLSHATRRFILGTIIALNTVLFGINLIKDHDLHAALVNFLTCCVCWVGVYFISWSERSELSVQEKKRETGEEYDDDE